jgi:hypothetical protein
VLVNKFTERGCFKVWDHTHSNSPKRLATFSTAAR